MEKSKASDSPFLAMVMLLFLSTTLSSWLPPTNFNILDVACVLVCLYEIFGDGPQSRFSVRILRPSKTYYRIDGQAICTLEFGIFKFIHFH